MTMQEAIDRIEELCRQQLDMPMGGDELAERILAVVEGAS